MKACPIFKKIKLFIWLIFMFGVSSVLMFCSKSDSPNNGNAKTTEISGQKSVLVQNAMAAPNESATNAAKAIEMAQQNHQYLALIFYNQKDASLQEMDDIVTNFQTRSSKEIQVYKALTTDLKEADIIKEYGVDRAPLPLLLVFAPNGAVTGGFPLQQISRERLEQAIVSELMMKLLKTVQSNRVALVLLKNDNTAFNDQATQAAEDFAADKRLNGFVDIIQQNPLDATITDFLNQCKLDKNLQKATVALVVPPGQIGGVYSGNITKDTLINGLVACTAGSGCCGPR
ncbi:MAG: hypothetical protein U5R06_11485 [candidate division KSB1 bacterium]|nr:hypothetical protein [candidate division KSB1 bacterium]